MVIMDHNINLTILNEVHKGAKMGMDSISYISEKLQDDKLKDNLSYQFNEYGKIVDRVNEQFQKYGEIPDEEDVKDKIMSWTGVQMNTLTDKTSSHIAEIMLQGTTMGIIEGRKLINHNPKAQPEVKKILDDFVVLQENNAEKLKEFL